MVSKEEQSHRLPWCLFSATGQKPSAEKGCGRADGKIRKKTLAGDAH